MFWLLIGIALLGGALPACHLDMRTTGSQIVWTGTHAHREAKRALLKIFPREFRIRGHGLTPRLFGLLVLAGCL